MWHPASLLLTWFGFALGLSWMPTQSLLPIALACIALAAAFAAERARNLLWRSRWLLMSLGTLFLFFTPGEFLPGLPGRIGLTYEGLRLCAEQLSRLLAMLASLALLHQRVGTQGLLIAFYWLLRPFPRRGVTVVRLMLVLDFVEQRRRVGWREWLVPENEASAVDAMYLTMPLLRGRDKALMGMLLAILGLVVWL